MYKQYTARDILKKARTVAITKSACKSPYGKFKYLDHLLIVGDDDCEFTAVRVKLERTYGQKNNIKEIVYEDEYL